MNRYELSYEEIYGLDEDDTEEEKLRSKVEKLEKENEDLKDTINFIKEKLEHDIKINERCLEEPTDTDFRRLLTLWIKFDKELLEIANDE